MGWKNNGISRDLMTPRRWLAWQWKPRLTSSTHPLVNFRPRRDHGVYCHCPVHPTKSRYIPLFSSSCVPTCSRAGKPIKKMLAYVHKRVYPRPCGETAYPALIAACVPGLSPPVRGNPARASMITLRWRSIPARAGKPRLSRSIPAGVKVYPRPCGETFRRDARALCATGLSPPVRGNHSRALTNIVTPRSIPARAGKPRTPKQCAGHRRVYPRPCGETRRRPPHPPSLRGLSPPVRGNPRRNKVEYVNFRSIPARAGKPVSRRAAMPPRAVYPRPCGETMLSQHARLDGLGLSPPVRGNPASRTGPIPRRRSIPARAGKPEHAINLPILNRVYPRPCGETAVFVATLYLSSGLSPPVRGKPRLTRCSLASSRVYPRPCGETTCMFAVLAAA